MKRKAVYMLIALVTLFLAACGDKVSERTFEAEENGVKVTTTYEHKGDEVLKQKTKSIISYETIGVTSEEEAKQIMEMFSAGYEGIDGVDYKLKYSDSDVTEHITIDYESMDLEKAKEIPELNISGDVSEGISMEKTAELMEEQGLKEVE